ncbi:hypothetical protein LPJ55_001953 [Coemansia sp. RSA 990]|nr:hypothetical protein LPJ55_001953 [Coemansia sp. RSA 990]
MSSETPTRRPAQKAVQSALPVTPMGQVLQHVDRITPHSDANSSIMESPFSTPALLRLNESSLRDRLREAYGLLKEKERNLFLAATVGQELVEANQQLQDSHQKLQNELDDMQKRLKQVSESSAMPNEHSNEAQALGAQGRRQSMHLQQKLDGRADASNNEHEKQWIKVHVQPLKAQLQMSQERTDELLAEREELGAQVYELRQSLSAALRRSNESASITTAAQQRLEKLEEEKVQLQKELEEQRAFWAKRWSEHQKECKAGANEKNAQIQAEQYAEDAAARIRAEQRASDLQIRYSTVQAENEMLRTQMQQTEEERVNEWEPMRTRWLASEEALQELQETHQSTCEALAQAEARLAEFDKCAELNDPIKLKSQKTSTSLLGELDMQRHKAVLQQQTLAREHTALKRAYNRAVSSQSRMKQQVARLTQLAATGANEARMRRLEAALGEAECQQQALLWASMEHRRPSGMDIDVGSGSTEMEGTALVASLRARLKQITADRDQTQRELRTAYLLRANEIQKTRDMERELTDTEVKLRRAIGELTSLRADHDSLRQKLKYTKLQANESSVDAKEAEQHFQLGKTSPTIPPRKRTSSRAGLEERSGVRKSGPMSLSFMINSEGNAVPETNALPPVAGSDARLTSSAKRHRVMQNLEESECPCSAASEAGSSVDANGGLSEVRDAADRGMKTWLGSLGAVHGSPLASDSHNSNTSIDTSVKAIPNDHTASADETRPSIRRNGKVDEIHIGSQMALKPMECNNQ